MFIRTTDATWVSFKMSPIVEQTIVKAVNTPVGRALLARSMVQPLRTRRDYEKCPSCGATMTIDPAVLRRHPNNNCPFDVLYDVMES